MKAIIKDLEDSIENIGVAIEEMKGMLEKASDSDTKDIILEKINKWELIQWERTIQLATMMQLELLEAKLENIERAVLGV